MTDEAAVHRGTRAPLMLLVLGALSLSGGHAILNLHPWLSWLPWGEELYYISDCDYIVAFATTWSAGDWIIQLAWILLVLAAFAALRTPKIAANVAAVALTLAALSAGIYSSTWVETSVVDRAPPLQGCPETAAEGLVAANHAMYELALWPSLLAAVMLLALSYHVASRPPDGDLLLAPFRQQARQVLGLSPGAQHPARRWWRWAAAVALAIFAGLAVYGTAFTELAALEERVGAPGLLPLQPLLTLLVVGALLVLWPVGPPHRVGTTAWKLALGYAFAHWSMALQTLHSHRVTVANGRSDVRDIKVVADLDPGQMETLGEFVSYYETTGVALLVLWIVAMAVRWLVLAPAAGDEQTGTTAGG